jgi:hypothetical protein
MYNVIFRRICVTIVAVEKQNVLNILSVCSVALFIQHAERMRRIIMSSLACLTLPLFSTLSKKNGTIFGKNVIEHKMCALIVSTNFVSNISHSKKNSAKYYHSVHRFSFKVPFILVRF